MDISEKWSQPNCASEGLYPETARERQATNWMQLKNVTGYSFFIPLMVLLQLYSLVKEIVSQSDHGENNNVREKWQSKTVITNPILTWELFT